MSRAQQLPPTGVPTVTQSLSTFTVDELKWIATVFAGPTPARKGELVAVLDRTLTDQATVQAIYKRLAPAQQQVVAEVVHNLGGIFNAEIVEARYGPGLEPAHPRGYEMSGFYGIGMKKRTATPYDVLFGYSPELGRFIPADLAAILATFVPRPAPFRINGSPDPPEVINLARYGDEPPETMVSDVEPATFHDLTATLYLIQQGKITVSAATRQPTLASLRALRERLLVGDYFPEDYGRAEDAMRPLALVMLAQAAKWAAPAGAGNKLELTKSGEKLLGGPIGADQAREAWEKWLKSDLLDELSRVRGVKGQQAKGTRLTKPAERRGKLAAALRECPVGEWVSFDELLRSMRATGQLPVIERTMDSNLYVGSSREYGWLGYSGVKYWDVVTGSFLRVLLWEYAATLGMVEIAYTYPEKTPHDFGEIYGLEDDCISRYDGLLAFRLTSLGAYVLGMAGSYSPPAPAAAVAGTPSVQLLPNFDVVITDARQFMPNDQALLERFTLRQSENVYRLDRERLLDAAQHGLSLQQAREFLAARSGLTEEAFPQTVGVFFADLERRMGALREGGRMVLLEGDDPYLLTELANNAALRGLVRLAAIDGRTVLLVPEESESAVRKTLKKLGYIPTKR